MIQVIYFLKFDLLYEVHTMNITVCRLRISLLDSCIQNRRSKDFTGNLVGYACLYRSGCD